ncbi:MAG: hypothetical protein EA001_08475 [Oscillatoriales cyanobacterium]|nr:MAG: hypothetical protein EA001_08475 [Oscillatoriales cyanobacterium]
MDITKPTADVFDRLAIHPDRLGEFCQKWQAIELAVFGSVLTDRFRADSDLDFLVTFAPQSKISLLGLVQMEEELSELLGRSVDLLTRQSVQEDANWLRRTEILKTARTIYEL